MDRRTFLSVAAALAASTSTRSTRALESAHQVKLPTTPTPVPAPTPTPAPRAVLSWASYTERLGRWSVSWDDFIWSEADHLLNADGVGLATHAGRARMAIFNFRYSHYDQYGFTDGNALELMENWVAKRRITPFKDEDGEKLMGLDGEWGYVYSRVRNTESQNLDYRYTAFRAIPGTDEFIVLYGSARTPELFNNNIFWIFQVRDAVEIISPV